MRIGEMSLGAAELEFSSHELLAAKIGEVLDERSLAAHDLGKVERDLFGSDAPRFRVAGQVHHLGGIQEGLGWHASAQNAQAADFLAPFNDYGLQAFAGGGTGSGIPGAAAANDGEIVLLGMLHSCLIL